MPLAFYFIGLAGCAVGISFGFWIWGFRAIRQGQTINQLHKRIGNLEEVNQRLIHESKVKDRYRPL